MAIDFESLLTVEQKVELIQNRIAQFAAEAYQHKLNKDTALSIKSEEQAENAEKNIEILEAAITVHQAELAKLQTA